MISIEDKIAAENLHPRVAEVVADWIDRELPSADLAAEVGRKYGVEVRFNVRGCGQDFDFGRINVSMDTRTGRCLSATVG